MSDGPHGIVRAHGNVRGTQSFVHVMASIFKRPGLIGLEIAWRWVAALPLSFFFFGSLLGALGMDVHWGRGTPAANPPLHPEELRVFGAMLLHGGFIWGFSWLGIATGLAVLLFWVAACGWMRSLILRRLDSHLKAEVPTVVGLSVLRVFSFLLFVYAWGWLLFVLWSHTGQRSEPAYVPAFALAVIGTLVLFSVWSMVSWIFPLATVLAMSQGLSLAQSLRAALKKGVLRSKLIEINLVMGIVKVALLVLAMVFSASPLPFSSVATQSFLSWWWFGCFLFWVLASDYFHVVRAAAYLGLWRAYQPPALSAPPPDEKAAS